MVDLIKREGNKYFTLISKQNNKVTDIEFLNNYPLVKEFANQRNDVSVLFYELYRVYTSIIRRPQGEKAKPGYPNLYNLLSSDSSVEQLVDDILVNYSDIVIVEEDGKKQVRVRASSEFRDYVNWLCSNFGYYHMSVENRERVKQIIQYCKYFYEVYGPRRFNNIKETIDPEITLDGIVFKFMCLLGNNKRNEARYPNIEMLFVEALEQLPTHLTDLLVNKVLDAVEAGHGVDWYLVLLEIFGQATFSSIVKYRYKALTFINVIDAIEKRADDKSLLVLIEKLKSHRHYKQLIEHSETYKYIGDIIND